MFSKLLGSLIDIITIKTNKKISFFKKKESLIYKIFT